MSQPEYPLRARRSQFAVAVTAWLLLTGAAWAQAPPSTVRLIFPIVAGAPDDALPAVIDADATVGVQRITLKQAKQLAVHAGNPAMHLQKRKFGIILHNFHADVNVPLEPVYGTGVLGGEPFASLRDYAIAARAMVVWG